MGKLLIVINTRSFIELIIAGILMLIGIIAATMVEVLALQQGIQTPKFINELSKNVSRVERTQEKNRHRIFFSERLDVLNDNID